MSPRFITMKKPRIEPVQTEEDAASLRAASGPALTALEAGAETDGSEGNSATGESAHTGLE